MESEIKIKELKYKRLSLNKRTHGGVCPYASGCVSKPARENGEEWSELIEQSAMLEEVK